MERHEAGNDAGECVPPQQFEAWPYGSFGLVGGVALAGLLLYDLPRRADLLRIGRARKPGDRVAPFIDMRATGCP